MFFKTRKTRQHLIKTGTLYNDGEDQRYHLRYVKLLLIACIKKILYNFIKMILVLLAYKFNVKIFYHYITDAFRLLDALSHPIIARFV